jgi:hypothetical protein
MEREREIGERKKRMHVCVYVCKRERAREKERDSERMKE